MKHILLFPFLFLLSWANAQDETAAFKDAIGAAFDYLSTEIEFLSFQMGVEDPLVFPTFAMEPAADVIRQDANHPDRAERAIFDFSGIDIEEAISTWEKYKGEDLSIYVAENHLHLLMPEDSQRDQGTNVSFSAPIFSNDTLFFCYMVFEINDEHKENSVRQYMVFGRKNDSWHWFVESRFPKGY
jgi:hypothetical protein